MISNGEQNRRFGESFSNIRVFIQRQTRHEHLTMNDQKAFWREVDTDLYLDTVRMELDEDDNHHHHLDHDHGHDRNHRHDRERNNRNDQLDLGKGRKKKRVTSSEGSANGQNNEDWAEGLHRDIERQKLRQFRIRHNRREQSLSPVQTVTGAPVYMLNIRTVQEEAFRIANNISPNLDEQSSVSWTSPESINQERNTSFVSPKLRRKEEGHLSEVKPQAQILLLSQTRTRSKTNSADSQVRAPGRFQLMGIQNRTKEELHTLEIFPRILMEETLQPQLDT
ncbi:MAG: hypothetical protein EZS28_015075 [Streblomastix strix]|uniref:Uncharacterized protein n=1 Tax=Streblomastix strix TaxID=222440 RepID=A0A5J4W408_9EUKA|nr:MAG: hypothetical protein EZS28_015075 [Streblomastix strix]